MPKPRFFSNNQLFSVRNGSLSSRWQTLRSTDATGMIANRHGIIANRHGMIRNGLETIRNSHGTLRNSHETLHSTRGMATHRDLGYGGSSNGRYPGGFGLFDRLKLFWGLFKMPILFTGAVILANSIIMPAIFSLPAFKHLQRRPDLIVYGIIGLNILGFLAWKSPIGARYMYKYGLLQKDFQFNLASMIGSAFSHQEIWHLGLNMFALYQFGLPVAQWLGSDLFLQAYLDSAVISSLGSLIFPVLANSFKAIPSLGASGAIFSLFGIFSFLAPGAKVFLFFIPIPLNTMFVFLGSMAWSCGGLLMRKTMFDHAGHLGGCIAGLGWGYYLQERIRKAREKRRQEYRIGRGGWW